MVEHSGVRSNHCPSTIYAVRIVRRDQAFEVVLDADLPDMGEFLRRVAEAGLHAAASRLGVSTRQVRRLLAGDLGDEQAVGLALDWD